MDITKWFYIYKVYKWLLVLWPYLLRVLQGTISVSLVLTAILAIQLTFPSWFKITQCAAAARNVTNELLTSWYWTRSFIAGNGENYLRRTFSEAYNDYINQKPKPEILPGPSKIPLLTPIQLADFMDPEAKGRIAKEEAVIKTM